MQSWNHWQLRLRREEQNKFGKKCYLQWGLNMGPLVIHSQAHLTELTWQELIEGHLTSLLLMHQQSF